MGGYNFKYENDIGLSQWINQSICYDTHFITFSKADLPNLTVRDGIGLYLGNAVLVSWIFVLLSLNQCENTRLRSVLKLNLSPFCQRQHSNFQEILALLLCAIQNHRILPKLFYQNLKSAPNPMFFFNLGTQQLAWTCIRHAHYGIPSKKFTKTPPAEM